MAVFDSQRAWLHLKAYVDSKASHGRSDLHQRMNQLEVEFVIPEAEEGFDPRPLPRRRSDADAPLEAELASSAAMDAH